jgi:hypothetical protein
MKTDMPMPKATRLIAGPDGGFVRVPAHVAAPPRLRGGIQIWLKQRSQGNA